MKSLILHATVLIGATAAGLWAQSPPAEQNSIARSQLVGLDESLHASLEFDDPGLIARQIWAHQFDRFIQMRRDWLKYRGEPAGNEYPLTDLHRAGALCLDELGVSSGLTFMYERVSTYASAWGFASGAKSQVDAETEALANCEDAKKDYGHKGCKCQLVARDEGAVANPPNVWLEAVAPLQQKIQANKVARLQQSQVAATLPFTLDSVQSQTSLLTNDALRFLADFRLRYPIPLVIGYPDEMRDYAGACHERYSYAVLQIDLAQAESILKELSPIDIGKPFGCYRISINTRENPKSTRAGEPTELQCRYVDHVSPRSSNDLRLPVAWTKVPQLKDVSDIWVESVVRVNEQGFPLEKRPFSKPLLIKSATGTYYLAVEVIAPRPNGGCTVTYPFHDKVFDVAGCSDRFACASRALGSLSLAMSAKLASPPFAAGPNTAHPKPGEMQFDRNDKPSLLLGGAYYERSTYTMQSWAADSVEPPDALYQQASYLGVQQRYPKYLFAELQHIYTIAKNKAGPFRDALTDEESSAINDAVKQLLPSALAEACVSLGATLTNGVCFMGGTIK
jgi:hypothetical protein